MSKSVRDSNDGGDFASMYAQATNEEQPKKVNNNTSAKGGDNDFTKMYAESQKKKLSSNDGGNTSKLPSQSESVSTSQQEINDAFGLHGIEKPTPTINDLDPIERKNLNDATPIPVNPASNQQAIKDIIDKRKDPVQKIKNATDFYEDDMKNNPDAIKGIDPKKVLAGGEKENANTYYQKRTKELEDLRAHIVSNIITPQSPANMIAGLAPSVQILTEEQQQNNSKLQQQVAEIDEHLEGFNKYANILNAHQAVTSVPLPKDNSSESMKNYYRDIGIKTNVIDNPIAVEHKEDNIKTGIDSKRNAEIVGLENYRYASQGLDAAEENAKAKFGLGNMSEYEYNAQVKEIQSQRSKLFDLYPEAKSVAQYQAIGQVLEQNRKNKEDASNGAYAIGSSVYHNIVKSGYSEDEINDAAKQMKLSPDEIKKIINNKDDIPGTSFLGNFYNSFVAHGSQDLMSLFRSSEKNEDDRYTTDKSFQLNEGQQFTAPETIKDIHPTIKTPDGKEIANPNYLKDVNNPNAGNHNWGYGALNQVGSATGSLANLWLTTEVTGGLGDAAFGGMVGADAVAIKNTGQGLKEITKFSTEQKSLFGNVVGMTLTNFAQNKEQAKEFIGKEQGGEKAQNVYALTRGLETGLLFGLGFSPQKLVGKALGLEEKEVAKEFADMIHSKGIDYLDKDKWSEFLKNNLVKKIGVEGLQENAKSTAMMAIDQAVQVGTQAMFNPQSVQNKNIGNDILTEGVKNFLTFAPISFLGAGVGVLNNPHTNQAQIEQEAIYRMGKDPITYKNYVDGQVKDFKINQEDANKRIHLVNEMAAVHNSGIVNENLSRSEKIEYANNALHEKVLQQQIDKAKSIAPTDPSIKIKERQVEDLQNRRSEILNNSDGVDKDANGKPLTPTYKIDDKSVTKDVFQKALKGDNAKDILANAEVSGDEKTQAKFRELGGTSESEYKTSSGLSKEEKKTEKEPLSFVGKQDDVLVKDRNFFNEKEEKDYHDLISDGKQDDADLMIEQRKKELIEQDKNDISSQLKTAQNEDEKAKEASKGQDVVSKEESAEPVSEVGSSTTKEDLKDTLDKAQVGNTLSFSPKNGSQYWAIDNENYRVSDHDKPDNANYKLGVNDFRSVDDLYNHLKTKLDLSDKTEKEKQYKNYIENKIKTKENGLLVTPDGTIFDDIGNAKDYMWNNFGKEAIDKTEGKPEGLFNDNGATKTGKETFKAALEKGHPKSQQEINAIRKEVFGDESFYNDKVSQSVKGISDAYMGKGGESEIINNEPPKPPTEEPLNLEGKSPEKQWTAIRKSKQVEIDAVKNAYEAQSKKAWSKTLENALNNLQTSHPDKNLYDAAISEMRSIQAGVPSSGFTPDESIAAMQYLKREIEGKRASLYDNMVSNDELLKTSAVVQNEALSEDYANASLAIKKIGTQAGITLNYLQSELGYDEEHGLQLKRMDLASAKGEKLNDEELAFTSEQWEKEKELNQKIQEAREKGMQESFDKEISRLKEEYDKKLKDVSKKEPPKEENRKKLLSQSGKEFADKLRSGKLKGGTYSTIPGFPQAVNLTIEAIAQIVEKGSTLADAIAKYIDDNKIKDKDRFTDNFMGVLENRQTREDSFDKIKEHAELNKVSGITAEMVGKNLIRDYVNSHIGDVDTKDILNVATEGLKEVFPDITKEKLTEAYLKRGEFEQPTKKKLENDFKESQNKLTKLAKIENDLSDFKEKKNLYTEKTPESKIRETDKDIAAKEKELKQALNDAGVKTSNEDKYAKSSYKSRAQYHNERIDALADKIKQKIENSNLSDENKNVLTKLNSQLESSKVKLSENSKFSDAPVLDNGLSILKKVKSEFDRNIKVNNISSLGEFKRELQKAIDKFGNDKDESEQNIKLERSKDKYQRDIDEYKRKINAGEFEDKPIIELHKYDAELIKLDNQKRYIQQVFNSKKNEYEKANKGNAHRTAEFFRSAYVDYLISSPLTYAKVAFSAVLRPNVEALTKKVGGSIFNKVFPELSQRAKLGGESSTVGTGYEAYARQYSPEQLEKKYTEANDKYEKSSKAYNEFKGEVDRMDKRTSEYEQAKNKLEKLDNKRKTDLVSAVGNSMYNFIAGSSVKESLNVLFHRTATIEKEFGQFDTEQWQHLKDSPNKYATVLDNINYTMNYIGRSHAALKTFSGRFSFAASFTARLEGAVNDGIDVTKPDKILEIANESYIDWDRGKYQQSNKISDAWNQIVQSVDKISKPAAYIMKSDVAVTRVPVNILHEAIVEYSLGAITSAFNIGKEYYKAAKNIDLKADLSDKDKYDFRSQLKEELLKLDPDKAAAIVRSFRKGGFGLGMYALGALGIMQFGGFGHQGQAKDDKKIKKIEDETGEHQLVTGEIDINGKPINGNVAKIIEHGSPLYPLFLGTGLYTVYKNNIKEGKSSSMAAVNDGLQHINTILGSIPQISKVFLPMAADVYKSLVPKIGSWDDVDQEGNPMKRKAFEIRDYLNILPGYGDKKDVLSDMYYKQASRIKSSYEQQKSEIENNANLSDEDKKKQKDDLDVEENNDIDDIYKQNKENPQ